MSKKNRKLRPLATAPTAPAAPQQVTNWPVDGNGSPVNDNHQGGEPSTQDEIGTGAPDAETPEQRRERLLAVAAVFAIEDAEALATGELEAAVREECDTLKMLAEVLGVDYSGDGSARDIDAHAFKVSEAYEDLLTRSSKLDVAHDDDTSPEGVAKLVAAVSAAEAKARESDAAPTGEPQPEPIQPGARVRVLGDRNLMDPETMDATVTAVWGDGCVDVREGWRVMAKVPPQGSVPEGRRCYVRL